MSCATETEKSKLSDNQFVITSFTKSSIKQLKPLASEIHDKFGYLVRFNYIYNDSDSKDNINESLNQYTKKINKSDLIVDMPSNYISTLVKNNTLVRLNQYIKKDNINIRKYYSPVINLSKRIGHGYLVSLSPTFNTTFLGINEDIFKKYNVPVPQKEITWDQLEKAAKEIKKNSRDSLPTIYPISFGPGAKSSFFIDYNVLSLPIQQPIINSKNLVYSGSDWHKNISLFTRLFRLYGLQDASDEEFFHGKVAMKIMYTSDLSTYLNKNNWTTLFKKFHLKIIPAPIYTNEPDMTYIRSNNNLLIPKISKHKEKAWKIIKYVMSKQFALKNLKKKHIFYGDFMTYYDKDTLKIYKKRYKGVDPKVFYFGKEAPQIFSYNYQNYDLVENLTSRYFYQMLDGTLSVNQAIEYINRDYRNQLN
jgi:ABC-type glycerol-3-phosphate transport system substrate-binding protein